MSAIQIVCAVAVPLLWGYQFVVIKVGVLEFPPLFFLSLRFLAIALLLISFVKRPARQQFGRIAAISGFLGGLNFGLFYVGLGLGAWPPLACVVFSPVRGAVGPYALDPLGVGPKFAGSDGKRTPLEKFL